VAAQRRVEHLDGVCHGHRGPARVATCEGCGHLHQAAWVGGHEQVGAGGGDVLGLAVAERLCGLGVEQV
jgi:hypothetical protein